MAEQSVSLLPLYKGWDTYQELLLKTITPLTQEQLSLRTASHLRSVGGLATHIVGTRAGWLHFVLERGGDNMLTLARWNQPDQPSRSASELVDGLLATWQVIQDTLQAWTIADLAGIVHDTDDNGEVHTLTRQWVLWHLIEHDLHHGGELSYTLGTHGIPGINI